MVLAVLLAAVVAIAAAGFALYGRQTKSYLTHRKGGPEKTWAFEPFPANGGPELRIGVVGDGGDAGSRLDATAASMTALEDNHPYGALLLLGDNAYREGAPSTLDRTVFQPFKSVLDRGARLLAVLGNHDVMDGHGPAQLRALGMPGPWWAETFGDVLIVGLDSTQPQSAAQRAWLDRTLATTSARWKIVALHHPPFSAGYQGSNQAARDAFSPLFERYDVQLVLSGHDHDYQRSKPIKGVTYIVSGGASGTRRTGEDDFTAASFSWTHFVDVSIYPDRSIVRSVGQDQQVADEIVLRP